MRRLAAAALGLPSEVLLDADAATDGVPGAVTVKGELLRNGGLAHELPRETMKRGQGLEDSVEEAKFSRGFQMQKLSVDVTVILPMLP